MPPGRGRADQRRLWRQGRGDRQEIPGPDQARLLHGIGTRRNRG